MTGGGCGGRDYYLDDPNTTPPLGAMSDNLWDSTIILFAIYVEFVDWHCNPQFPEPTSKGYHHHCFLLLLLLLPSSCPRCCYYYYYYQYLVSMRFVSRWNGLDRHHQQKQWKKKKKVVEEEEDQVLVVICRPV